MDNYLLCFVKQMKFFTTNAHKHFNTNVISMAIQSHNQNKYLRKLHTNIRKCQKNIIMPPTITVSVCYWLSSRLQVWADFLECRIMA